MNANYANVLRLYTYYTPLFVFICGNSFACRSTRYRLFLQHFDLQIICFLVKAHLNLAAFR